MLIGYMRVSKADGSQVLDLQRDALLAAGVKTTRMYDDQASGKKDDRPGLESCLKSLREGDTLIVWKLDRLGRNLRLGDCHGGRRADPREGVDHKTDQGAVAQARLGTHIDAVDQLAGLVGSEHRRLAAPYHMHRPAHGRRRVERQHAAGRQPIEHHAHCREALFDRGRREARRPAGAVGFLTGERLKPGRDMHRIDGRYRRDAVALQPGAEFPQARA